MVKTRLKEMQVLKTLSSGSQESDTAVITRASIKEFYDAILESPELYPYFMELGPKGLWRICNKMAFYFSRVLSKDRITPADTEHLKKIHHSLNISEVSYDGFTQLFSHICCRNKSDISRKKMLSTFALLKAHICPKAGASQNLFAFYKVIANLPAVQTKPKSTKWLDTFPELEGGCFLRSTEFASLESWNESAHNFRLRKRLRELQKLMAVIHHKSKRMELRISKLEVKNMELRLGPENQRDLDLVYS